MYHGHPLTALSHENRDRLLGSVLEVVTLTSTVTSTVTRDDLGGILHEGSCDPGLRVGLLPLGLCDPLLHLFSVHQALELLLGAGLLAGEFEGRLRFPGLEKIKRERH